MSATIRFATPDDAPRIHEIYAPYCGDSAVSFEIVLPTVAELGGRIATVLQRLPWLVCERSGVVVGYVYAGSHRERAAYQWCVEVAVYIAADCHRSGAGRALYAARFDLLRAQGYFHAYAAITWPNPASGGLHEALGFRHFATFERVGFKAGEWRDVGWMHLQLQPLIDDPPAPRPFSALSPEVIAAAIQHGESLLAGSS